MQAFGSVSKRSVVKYVIFTGDCKYLSHDEAIRKLERDWLDFITLSLEVLAHEEIFDERGEHKVLRYAIKQGCN